MAGTIRRRSIHLLVIRRTLIMGASCIPRPHRSVATLNHGHIVLKGLSTNTRGRIHCSKVGTLVGLIVWGTMMIIRGSSSTFLLLSTSIISTIIYVRVSLGIVVIVSSTTLCVVVIIPCLLRGIFGICSS